MDFEKVLHPLVVGFVHNTALNLDNFQYRYKMLFLICLFGLIDIP